MNIEDLNEPIFGKWYIVEEIGSGAFGTVYKIKRESFGKEYYSALKVIHVPQNKSEIKSLRKELGDDSSVSDYYTNFIRDFAGEIDMMAELKGNSNIVSFEDHDIIQDEDGIGWTILIRMELLTPFADFQAEHDLDNHDVVRLGMDICSALELCEKRNIIHRDIKPDNIFLSKDGDYELGDFGIARELEKTTGGLSKKGTYSYMAPEVYLGKPYNNTVDIYSLGIVMYKLLNHNRAPFMPDYPIPITFTDREKSLQLRMRGAEIPDIKDIPKALNDIVKKACAYDPKDRYSSASELKQALSDVLNANAPTVKIEKQKPEIEETEPTEEFDEKTAGPFTSPKYSEKTQKITMDETDTSDAFDEKTLGPFSEKNESVSAGLTKSLIADKKYKKDIIISALVTLAASVIYSIFTGGLYEGLFFTASVLLFTAIVLFKHKYKLYYLIYSSGIAILSNSIIKIIYLELNDIHVLIWELFCLVSALIVLFSIIYGYKINKKTYLLKSIYLITAINALAITTLNLMVLLYDVTDTVPYFYCFGLNFVFTILGIALPFLAVYKKAITPIVVLDLIATVVVVITIILKQYVFIVFAVLVLIIALIILADILTLIYLKTLIHERQK